MGKKIALVLLLIASLTATVWRYKVFGLIAMGPVANTSSVVSSQDSPSDTIVVFNLRAQGDKDAVLYSIGFARALSDWFYSAPKSLVQQPSWRELSAQYQRLNSGPGDSLSDDLAMRAGERLGVRYAVAGDLKLNGDGVSITLRLLDVTADDGKSLIKTAHRSGSLSDLPAMQVALGREILQAMKPPKAASQFPVKPVFRKPETLVLYGKSYRNKNLDEVERLRWQMCKSEGDSLFATLRTLEFYVNGPLTWREIRDEDRLRGLLARVGKTHAGNAYVDVLRAQLQLKQFEYRKAQGILESAVTSDPGLVRAHDLLAYTAIERYDADLAIKEAKKVVALWPTRASSHALLSKAYDIAANNARQGHYFNDMSGSVKRAWRQNSEEALKEARIAISLDSDCVWAWKSILDIAREIGPRQDVEAAFGELMRIDPKDLDAYQTYGVSLSPQWGGERSDQEAVFAQAESAFGQGSAEVCVIRGWVLMANADRAETREERLRLAETALSKAKDPQVRLSALQLKCRVLMGLKRHDEMLEVAKKGFELHPDLGWRMELAKAYQFRWQDARDRAALDSAANLLKVYVEDLPLSPYGRVQYGWCLSHQGDRNAARAQFLKALELDPANELAKEKLQYVQ